jgi:hypothetical protein
MFAAATCLRPAAAIAGLRETACVGSTSYSGEPPPGCPLATPSPEDTTSPVAALQAPSGRYLYVVESSGIVEERLEGTSAQPMFASCSSRRTTPDCTRISDPAAIYGATSAVLSPNGQNIYVASHSGIARFAVAQSSGGVEFAECVGLEGGECTLSDYGSQAQEATIQLAIASDGRDLYLTHEGTLSDFHIAPDGGLSFGLCYRFRSVCPSQAGFYQPASAGEGREAVERSWGYESWGTVAVSPNGEFVLTALGEDTVDVYRRMPDGSLRFTSCMSAFDVECPSPKGKASTMFHEKSIGVAPNSRDVYVSGQASESEHISGATLVHLRLSAAGTLEYAGCVGSVAGCGSPGTTGLDNSWTAAPRVAITPDGKELITTGSEAIVSFRLNAASGEPTYEACAGPYRGCAADQVNTVGPQGGSITMTAADGVFWVTDEDDPGRSGRFEVGAEVENGSAASRPSTVQSASCSPPLYRPGWALTANTLIVSGSIESCGSMSVTLEYGSSRIGEHTITTTAHPSSGRYDVYELEATGLTPDTSYSWRVTTGSEVLEEQSGTTLAVVPPAFQLSAATGSASANAGIATLTGEVMPGDTSVIVSVDIFSSANPDTFYFLQEYSLGGLPASRTPSLVSDTVSGLACGRTYYWRLAASAPYGESIGAKESFSIPCQNGQQPPPAGEYANGGPPEEEANPQPPPSAPGGQSPATGETVASPFGALTPTGPAHPSSPNTESSSGAPTPVPAEPSALEIREAVLVAPFNGSAAVHMTVLARRSEQIRVSLILKLPHGTRARALTLSRRDLALGAGQHTLTLPLNRTSESLLHTHASWTVTLELRPNKGALVTRTL